VAEAGVVAEAAAVEAVAVEAVSRPAGLHHVELWVPDLAGSLPAWRWLLESMGWRPFQDWEAGKSWRLGDVYLVMEQSPALTADRHERRRPGLNHLAFHAGGRSDVDALVAAAPEHGWTLMFAERHPYAGGPDHYAAYLEDGYGFEVELVAADPD
jgi:catechol 2,3-dioxygenase-like lactoylglutathione lyase family enzyme